MIVLFFKQKTAYEMRISDWSSDVCSSDLQALTEITGTRITNLQGLPDDFRPELPAGGDAETWVASALENNPSLRSLEYQVSSAEQGVSSARGGHYPTLGFGASYGNSETWGGTNLDSPNREGATRTIGLAPPGPTSSGGQTQSPVRQALPNTATPT